MRAEPLDIDIVAALREHQARRAQYRDQQLTHLSTICHYIDVFMEPERFGNDEPNPLIFNKGFLWEDVLSTAFASQWGNLQVELEWPASTKPRIVGTVDGLSLVKRRIKEYKNTKMSSRTPIVSNRYKHWHRRTMGYCYMASCRFGRPYLQAEYVVMHVNGHYEKGGGRFGDEEAMAHLVTFGEIEMQENWDSIITAYEEMQEKGLVK